MYGLNLLVGRLSSVDESTFRILSLINKRQYDDAIQAAINIEAEIAQVKQAAVEDAVKNEAFVYSCYFRLLLRTATYWKHIEEERYNDSWCSLQDAIDCLRTLKRFCSQQNRTISFLTKQLLSLEVVYPYKFFSSCGFVVEKFECSICHQDIDSDNCIHLKGCLYAGEMAIAIARNIKTIDHVAIVTNPKNKRLVLVSDDNRQEFDLFRKVVSDFDAKKISPLGFTHTKITESMRINESHIKAPRNSRCYCDSGKKYKQCCIKSERMVHIHMDLFPGHLMSPT